MIQGWSKEKQKQYPVGWAKTLASLRTSKRNTGKKQSDFQKRRAREANLGNKHRLGDHKTIEERLKISISSMGKPGTNTGKKFSEEIKQKMRDSQKRAHWKYNKTPEEIMEICRKISVARQKQILPIKDTIIEIKLQNELKKRDINFEKHKKIFGLPDIFINPNICVFCDGDYWHANPKKYLSGIKIRFGGKILTSEQIREKDKKITEKLIQLGYKVFRFWESEILKDAEACVDKMLLE